MVKPSLFETPKLILWILVNNYNSDHPVLYSQVSWDIKFYVWDEGMSETTSVEEDSKKTKIIHSVTSVLSVHHDKVSETL